MNAPDLSPRLLAAALEVRPGARLVDVGTDHAYLPSYLAASGRISCALATDIAEGPVRRALSTVRACKVENLVRVARAPGLDAAKDFSPSDIVIAGMGGELIASILESAPFVKDPGVLLILQPMTRHAALRRFLASSGFAITREALIREDGRIYQVLCAAFTGAPYRLTPLEYEVGARNLEARDPALLFLLSRMKVRLVKAIEGKKRGGKDPAEEQELLKEITDYLNERTPFL